MILAPSLLCADFSRLAEEMAALETAGVSWLHLDVMDGNFVPNITFGPPFIKSLRPASKLFFDVHLMIEAPARHLKAFKDAGADMLVIHAETDRHAQRTLAEIHALGLKAGLALNPGTDISVARWLAKDIDMLLLMAVNPGFAGQSFLPGTYEKLRAAKKLLVETGAADVPVQVDGGVCPENAADLVEAGADVLVSGSSFFGHKPYNERHTIFARAAGNRQPAPSALRAATYKAL